MKKPFSKFFLAILILAGWFCLPDLPDGKAGGKAGILGIPEAREVRLPEGGGVMF